MVDQRGTGRSGSVRCGFEPSSPACAKKLGARRAFLTTAETARDLDDLRAALGLETITPLGISYGTKVAGEYARRFPDRTASVILDSPVGVDPIDFDALGGIAAMPRRLMVPRPARVGPAQRRRQRHAHGARAGSSCVISRHR